ncbi:MAG TPA: hypothetical protein VLJ68_13250 [Chitinophagaceae bacterium]|nr:hypothetical protein [Chitinophagaceae bacterium]
MNKTGFVLLFLLFSIVACNSNHSPAPADSDVDAAREFLRAALDGDFTRAKSYLLQDSANLQCLDIAEEKYQHLGPDTINGYRGASITFYTPPITPNDSTTILAFSNSFMNQKDTLRIVRVNGNWLVDLKYLYINRTDTLYNKMSNIDTAQ